MTELPPEIPYPFRPWQEPPRRTTPLAVPVVDTTVHEPFTVDWDGVSELPCAM